MHDRDRAACQYLGLRHDGTHVWDLEFAVGRWNFRGIAFYGVPFHRRLMLAWRMHRERKRAGKRNRADARARCLFVVASDFVRA
jgi:hypothetical protein